MLVITAGLRESFRAYLAENEYSPAAISRYRHDIQLLLDYAPEGLPDKAALNG